MPEPRYPHMSLEVATEIAEAIEARQARFDERLLVSVVVVLLNIGDRETPVACIRCEWRGEKQQTARAASGLPVCPQCGAPLLEGEGGMMPEREAYVRCPKAVVIASDTDPTWWCDCHGSGCNTLVRVAEGAIIIEDPDAAIERMRQATEEWAASGYWASTLNAGDAADLLAAAGEDT